MRLVKPSHEILFISPNPLELIEAAGRICYKSEDKITENSAEKFVKMVVKRGHHSWCEGLKEQEYIDMDVFPFIKEPVSEATEIWTHSMLDAENSYI